MTLQISESIGLTRRRNKQETGFQGLGLSDLTNDALVRAEYLQPTPVQAGLIPRAMEGCDVVAQARTGTGKTAAFVIPILEIIDKQPPSQLPKALILVPTRELAVQVQGETQKLSHGRRAKCVALYGGKPIRSQILKLRRGAQIIVGTPGRILDHMSRSTLLLNDLAILVLDEADRMLDIGFRPDIERIMRKCPRARQTLLLSATVPPPIERLARRYMREPEKLDCSPTDIAVETIQQFYFTVEQQRKPELLVQLLRRENPTQAIVFCRTKRGTERVHRRLRQRFKGRVGCIHGDMAQSARDGTMRRFRDGQVQVLVATDVVGRGIDVTGISHIINYDIPQFCDDYVHRVGRTGRMGREGTAFTFVTPEEGPELTRIEVRIDRLLVRDEIQGFEAETEIVADEELGLVPSDSDADADGVAADTTSPKTVPMLGRRGRSPRRHRRAL